MGRFSLDAEISSAQQQKLRVLGRSSHENLGDRDSTTLGQASPAKLQIVLESAMREPPNNEMIHIVGGLAMSGRTLATEIDYMEATEQFTAVSANAQFRQLMGLRS